ncbi:MAG: adenylosuccinate lyase [bacterium]
MIARYTREQMGKIWHDQNRLEKMLLVEVLAAEAWSILGKVPKSAIRKIKAKAKIDINRIYEIEKTVKHDVIAFLTQVGETIGHEARFLHIGMTSSDVLDTALSIQMVEAADLLIDDMEQLTKTIGKLAHKYKNTLIMGRSHGVHAEPTTFGLKMANWYTECQRAEDRLKKAKEIISVGKISGAVGTYAHLNPRIESLVCAELGLKPAKVSSQILQRDRHAEFLSMLALVAASLEKFAVEIRHLQRTEVLEVEEPFTKGQKGSSAMPHKRNPIGCENITGLARLLRTNALASLENVALWHERDISHSSVERVIIPDSCILLDFMLMRMNSILRDLRVYPENMKTNISKTADIIVSQRIMLELVEKGMKREDAYKIVQYHAMKARDEHVDYKEAIKNDSTIKTLMKEKDIDACFDLNYYIRWVNDIFKRLHIHS